MQVWNTDSHRPLYGTLTLAGGVTSGSKAGQSESDVVHTRWFASLFVSPFVGLFIVPGSSEAGGCPRQASDAAGFAGAADESFLSAVVALLEDGLFLALLVSGFGSTLMADSQAGRALLFPVLVTMAAVVFLLLSSVPSPGRGHRTPSTAVLLLSSVSSSTAVGVMTLLPGSGDLSLAPPVSSHS